MKSIRFGLGLLFLVFAAAGAVAEDALLKYIPSGTEYVVSVDVEALRKLPLFRSLAESDNSDVKAYREGFENDWNLRLEDCSKLLFAGGGKRLRGMLVGTPVTEKELTDRLRGFGDRFSISGERGKPVYCLVSNDSIPSQRRMIAATYLEPGIVLATEREYVAPFLAGLAVPAETRARLVRSPEGAPLAWSHINVEALRAGKKKKNDLTGMLLNGIRTIALKFDAVGDGAAGWRLTGDALCVDAASAQMAAMQFPMLLQLGAGMLFMDDQALGAELLKQVRIMPDQDRVMLELNVSKPLADRLGRFLESQAKKRIAPPDPGLPQTAVPAGNATVKRLD